MPTKKIADLPTPCLHREHDPPTHRVWANGIYVHICPACGHKQEFAVHHPTYKSPAREVHHG